MIYKIMSEASHSIIGMVSAKPVDMETRTANNEFSSLLLPGENRLRATLDKDGAEATADNGGEQFLAQLIGNDDQPIPAAVDREIVNTVTPKISINDSIGDIDEGEIELSADTLPSPVTVAEIGRFASTVRPLSGEPVEASFKTVSLTVGQYQSSILPGRSPGRSVSEEITVTTENKQPQQKTQTTENKPSALIEGDPIRQTRLSSETNSPKPILAQTVTTDIAQALSASNTSSENTVKAENSSTSANNPVKLSSETNISKPVPAQTVATDIPQAVSASNTAIAAKPYVDAELINRPKANGGNDKTVLAPAALKDMGLERPILDSLDLRLASNSKGEGISSRQALESDVRAATISADKLVSSQAKPSFSEMESLPAAGHLDTAAELPVAVPTAPVAGAQTATQRTVSFDWNAPQFAERFVSEMGDLKINGDLKKFEINPKNMGRLEVSFVSRGGVEMLQIEAESDAAREMIVQHSQTIQDMLKAQGRSDLTVRVDVRENMVATPHNNSADFGQQDGASAQEERSASSSSSQNRGATMMAEGDADPPAPSDNSRYA